MFQTNMNLTALLRGFWLFLIFFLSYAPTSSVIPTSAQGRTLSKEEALVRLKKAHIISETSPDTFASYRLTGCMQIELSQLPKGAASASHQCFNEETGVQLPFLAYVRVEIGNTRVTELIDINQAKGWQITSVSSAYRTSVRNVTALNQLKYASLLENTQHSLLALLALLNTSDAGAAADLDLSYRDHFLVLKWRKDDSVNEFFFNPQTFLCEKQVRTVAAGTTIFKYSDYRVVSTVRLPHTIVMVTKDGATVATRTVDHWSLAAQWPISSFDLDKIGNPD